ncbi:uncharacterized protein AB675_8552 [Cyphellophora attinorum]|uniref:Nitroreductase domain-containing protein n=1 Tax=Cyphellophora attinorum TaxID=1664694 RepID=A0A0N1HZP7_9EURO|nr:uncharacterized protein AB675_8552 [Phialophora attinorum]KPI44360.1 hypothetical protein AB675_8552 [Phialophora attinorum]
MAWPVHHASKQMRLTKPAAGATAAARLASVHDQREKRKTTVEQLLQEPQSSPAFAHSDTAAVETIKETLAIAQCSPSVTNAKLRQVTLVHDTALAALKEALANFSDQAQESAALPTGFLDATVIAVVARDTISKEGDILSMGMQIQSWVLLLEERGLLANVSGLTFEQQQVVEEALGIGNRLKVLCTLQIGYEGGKNGKQQVNGLELNRRERAGSVRVVSELTSANS